MVGVANLPPEHVQAMKRAGINKVLIAAEHASPIILKRMHKPISFDLVVEKCKMIKKHDLAVGTFWILGHPGETEETARVNLDAMAYLWENDLNDGQEVAMFTPYPGLPMLQRQEEEGFRLVSKDYSKYSRFDEPVIELATISYKRLCELHNEARGIAQNWLTHKRDFFSKDIENALKKVLTS
jgi:radical SAM superfamily enzyme YgiQ (UPF0313 family)